MRACHAARSRYPCAPPARPRAARPLRYRRGRRTGMNPLEMHPPWALQNRNAEFQTNSFMKKIEPAQRRPRGPSTTRDRAERQRDSCPSTSRVVTGRGAMHIQSLESHASLAASITASPNSAAPAAAAAASHPYGTLVGTPLWYQQTGTTHARLAIPTVRAGICPPDAQLERC
eukprot:COSAG02_NODE_67_length_42609_cov_14.506681_31_plen_173_part_00